MYPLRDFQRPPERFKISRILVTDMVVLSYAIQIRTLTHLFMLDRHQKEREDAIQSDQSGNGFIFSMFSYVLESQEFAYTYDIEDTLNFLGYTIEEVLNSKALLNGLNKALKKYGVALKK